MQEFLDQIPHERFFIVIPKSEAEKHIVKAVLIVESKTVTKFFYNKILWDDLNKTGIGIEKLCKEWVLVPKAASKNFQIVVDQLINNITKHTELIDVTNLCDLEIRSIDISKESSPEPQIQSLANSDKHQKFVN